MGFDLPVMNRLRRSSRSPIGLFATGAQGVIYDPRDVASLSWRNNLLTYTERFDAPAWTKFNSTVTASASTAPDGITTADRVTFSGQYGQVNQSNAVVTSGQTATVSVWIKRESGNTALSLRGTNGGAIYLQGITITDEWQRFSTQFTHNGTNNIGLCVEDRNATGFGSILIWGAQLELGTVATDYQRISDVNTEVIERFPSATMYQDSLGTTPVTTPGQAVGLRLDKSKALAAGPELVVNGDFASSADWVLTAASSGTISISGGVLAVTRSGGYTAAGQSISFVSGKTYKISVRARRTSGTGAIAIVVRTGNTVGDTARLVASLTPTGTFSEYSAIYVCANTEIGSLQLGVGTSDGVIEYDNATVREIAGNHAIQATAGARLTYGIEPKTGTRNQFLYTEDLTNGVWVLQNTAVTANAIAAPTGEATADKLASNASGTVARLVYQNATFTIGLTYTLTVRLKAAGVGFAYINLANGYGGARFDLTTGERSSVLGGTTATAQDLGDGWWLCRVTATVGEAGARANYIYLSNLGSSPDIPVGDGIYIWGAQLEVSSAATPYQKVVTAFEVTEAGVPTCHYCAYAGANTMATSAIDFTATDKMSVFIGVRKLSDATTAALVEFSANIAINTGSFLVTAPNTTGASGDYGFYSRGSVTVGSSAKSAANPAPITSVISAFGNISADERKIRVNGTGEVVDTSDQGTGNYGNYPLYIGRRADSTLPFTGRDYGIVIVGKATSAAEINITEAWLAANTPTVVL